MNATPLTLRAREDEQQVLHELEVGALCRRLQLLAWVAQLVAKLDWKHIIEPGEQRRLLPAPLSPEGFAEYQRTIKKLDLSKPFVNELIEQQMKATPLTLRAKEDEQQVLHEDGALQDMESAVEDM